MGTNKNKETTDNGSLRNPGHENRPESCDILEFDSQNMHVKPADGQKYESERNSSDIRAQVQVTGVSRYHRVRQILRPVRKNIRSNEFPIHHVGLFSFLTFSWLTSFAWNVYRHGCVDEDNLWTMPREDGSAYCGERLSRLWKEEVKKKGPEAASMGRVVVRFAFTRCLVCMCLYVLNATLAFVGSTFLLREILQYTSSHESDMWYGLTLCLALFVTEMAKSITMSAVQAVSVETAKRLKGAILHVLFDKLMRLKGLQDKSVGEVVNMCTNDAQRLVDLAGVLHYIVGGPVIVLMGTTYCYTLLGPWAVLGAFIILLYYPYQAVVSRLNSILRRKAVTITDKRVRMMNEILTCIKLIKLYAWEKPFSAAVVAIRAKEKRVLEKAAFLQTMSSAISPIIPVFASVCTFLAHILSGYSLNATQAFVVVTLHNLTRVKLSYIPQIVKQLTEARVAVERFQAFVSVAIYNLIRSKLSAVPRMVRCFSDSKVAMERLQKFMLMEEANANYCPIQDKANVVEISNATFAWPASKMVDKVESKATTDERDIAEDTKHDHIKAMNLNLAEDRALLQQGPESAEHLVDTLYNISLNIPKSALYGVCGKVGSGKSSLIAGLLGQMVRVQGTVGVNGTSAYVPQQAWVINDTLRENILFGLPYDKARYDAALDICCLRHDISVLPAGELTEIGERGINLSGGQKQRVSLARAVYSDRDIYLLDDPLSAVDSHVGHSLFFGCLKGALQGKTVLFITHQLQYLQQCDYILHMKEGCISEHGTHQNLMDMEGQYAALIKTFHSINEDDEEQREEGGPVVEGLQSPSLQHKKTQLDRILLEDSRERSSTVESLASLTKSEADLDEPQATGELMTLEDKEAGSLDSGTYKAYVKAAGGYLVMVFVLVLYALPVGCTAFSHWWLAYWLSQGDGSSNISSDSSNTTNETSSGGTGNMGDHPQLYMYATVYGLTAVAVFLALAIRGFFHMKITLRAASGLHNKVFCKILRCPMSFFDTTPVGRIVNRFSRDLDEVDVRLPMRIEAVLGNLVTLFVALILISTVFPWFLLSLIPVGLIFIFFYRIMHVCLREVKRVENICRSPFLSHLSTGVQGIHTIQAFDRQEHFLNRFHHLLDYNSVVHFLLSHVNRWVAVRLDLLGVSLTGLTALLVIIFQDGIPPAFAGLAMAYAITMTGNFQITLRNLADTDAHFVSVQRILYYIDNVQTEAAAIVADNRPLPQWPQEGAVVFTNYHMRYRSGLPLALKGINCAIKPREKIGIVGRTGSGKSSLAMALFRLVEPSTGSVHIDSMDISGLGLEDLRSRLSIIPQDPVLFVGTIRYNLDPFHEHSDGELWLALEKCHIKDMVSQVEGQLDAPVIENGENFSVGERQLICMARSLLRHSKILLLDEATASIDTETDSKIQQTIKEAFTECTMLTIAHRLNTILHCDRVMVLQDGKVVEFEQPSTLLSDPSSHFARMMQATDLSGGGRDKLTDS